MCARACGPFVESEKKKSRPFFLRCVSRTRRGLSSTQPHNKCRQRPTESPPNPVNKRAVSKANQEQRVPLPPITRPPPRACFCFLFFPGLVSSPCSTTSRLTELAHIGQLICLTMSARTFVTAMPRDVERTSSATRTCVRTSAHTPRCFWSSADETDRRLGNLEHATVDDIGCGVELSSKMEANAAEEKGNRE